MANRISKSARAMCWLLTLVYFASYIMRINFAVMIVKVCSDMQLEKSALAIILTGLTIAYGTGQVVSGFIGDKIKPRTMIIGGLALAVACNIAMFFAAGVPLMTVIWTINGVAHSMLWPPIVKILSHHLDHDTYVTAHLAVTSAAHVATVLLYVFVPICLSFMSWRTVFITASALAFVTMAIFAIAMRLILPAESESVKPVAESSAKRSKKNTGEEVGILHILRRSGIFTVFVCIVVIGFLRDGIESWLPMLYSEAFGVQYNEIDALQLLFPACQALALKHCYLHRRLQPYYPQGAVFLQRF